MVEIPDLGESSAKMWQELMLLSEHSSAPWTLIGAHMVALLGWANNRVAPRASHDADILVNARMVSDGTARISRDLQKRGFILDGVGRRARLFTVAGARTVAVPGGTQALKRSLRIKVRAGTTSGAIPTPNLLGALLVKLRAIDIDDQPDAQRRDVAFLLSLVADPDPLEIDISASERRWLRGHPEFMDPGANCYQGIEHSSDAATVYRRLARIG